jgi:SAM-dependent methyltransferase
MAETVMRKFYRQAEAQPERLPWHREEPSAMLGAVVGERGGEGRALDVGCGAGVLSTWMAQRGMQVTGIDLFPEAIAMAKASAERKGVTAEFVCTDLFAYQPERSFDVVYDSGCLHSLIGGDLAAYKRQVLRWLAPDGDYVLEHWGKRHALDWRPIGPRRRSEAAVQRLFAPELTLVRSEADDFAVPLPFGPKVRGVAYRFTRA